MQDTLYLIDGHSLIYRMYYAFLRKPMLNSKRRDVSILYGFTKYILEIIQKEKPTHLAVVFDPPGKTFRHEMYKEYKATRQAAPELVIEALEPLKEICAALDIPVFIVPGFEGDDVLGSLAVKFASEGLNVYMVTPDKDFGQLISPNIIQLKPGKAGAENEKIDVQTLCEKYKINDPRQIIEFLTICGDSADNVPGVKGVGEVGAGKLISKYGSIKGIYDHIGELTPKMAQMFNAAKDHIDLSHELVTIKTDIPLDVTADDLLLKEEHDGRIVKLFNEYEFPSLMKSIRVKEGIQKVNEENKDIEWKECGAEEICALAEKEGHCAVVSDTEPENVFTVLDTLTVAVNTDEGIFACHANADAFKSILINSKIAIYGYRLKDVDNMLHNSGMRLNGKLYDIELMHYLIDPEQNHRLDTLARGYLSMELSTASKSAGEVQMSLFDDEEPKDEASAIAESKRSAAIISLLGDVLAKELEKMALDKLYFQIEEPLIRVLGKMERNGVYVDLQSLNEFTRELQRDIARLEAEVRKDADDPGLNLSSPKQIGNLLFEQIKIDPKMKATKSGNYPTDEETLSNYTSEFPIVDKILEYRGLKKLLGTYIEPFGNWISSVDGRIHTTFNQSLTSTGRLSSSRPNLQNIPVRTEKGKMIRKAFASPKEGTVIVSADYSQIELRLMAFFCKDQHMIDAFCHGKDVHSMTAAKIFSVPVEEVTPELRRMAKTANFGIMYGISAFGLSQRLKIPRYEAKKIIDDYFNSFPSIRTWIDETIKQASVMGYVKTLFGRRRYIPEINSRNANTRALAERNAVNAPIQGTAADIIKMAMIRVCQRLDAAAMKSKMVLQIHDELLFEAPVEEVDKLKTILHEEMEHVITLGIPLTVECNSGQNWLEAH